MTKTLSYTLTFLLAFLASSYVYAAHCPTGVAANGTTNAACTCPSGTRSGKWKRSFKTMSLNLSSECNKAANNARAKCATFGRVNHFTWKKIRSQATNVLGYKQGFCEISYECRWSLIKQTATVNRPTGSSEKNVSGKFEYKQTKISLEMSNVCNKTVSSAKVHIAQKYKGVVIAFNVTNRQYRTQNVLGIKTAWCKITYTAKLRVQNNKPVKIYWCTK